VGASSPVNIIGPWVEYMLYSDLHTTQNKYVLTTNPNANIYLPDSATAVLWTFDSLNFMLKFVFACAYCTPIILLVPSFMYMYMYMYML
jgi:hypothetical protein